MPGIQASCSMFYALTLHKEEEEEKAKRVYVWECVSIGGGGGRVGFYPQVVVVINSHPKGLRWVCRAPQRECMDGIDTWPSTHNIQVVVRFSSGPWVTHTHTHI